MNIILLILLFFIHISSLTFFWLYMVLKSQHEWIVFHFWNFSRIIPDVIKVTKLYTRQYLKIKMRLKREKFWFWSIKYILWFIWIWWRGKCIQIWVHFPFTFSWTTMISNLEYKFRLDPQFIVAWGITFRLPLPAVRKILRTKISILNLF